MSLTDPTKSTTTSYDSDVNDYTAGEEPWNKNLEGYAVDRENTEAFTYQCDWTKWHGLYRNIPEIRSTIDTPARWIISKKIKMDEKAKALDKKMRTPLRKLLLRHYRTSVIGGDSYIEIIRDKARRTINLKILDPGTIEIRADRYGVIQEFAQVSHKAGVSKLNKDKETLSRWDVDEIFHLSNDPIADEIHGIPETEKLQKIIKMQHQLMDFNQMALIRYGKPTFFFEANTDDETELTTIKEQLSKVKKNFEDAVFPKGTLEKIERVTVPQYGTMDFLPTIIFNRSYFTESSGCPELVRGKSDEVSLAAGKLNLLAYKEMIIFKQMEYEEDIYKQLGMKIEFERPVEIDVEISRTEEEQNLKVKAKKQVGGDNQVVTPNVRTSTKK